MEVKTKLGSRLEARFAGFGVSAQTLEVVGDPIGAPGAVQVERVARFWNSVDGRERLSTRRYLVGDTIPCGFGQPLDLAAASGLVLDDRHLEGGIELACAPPARIMDTLRSAGFNVEVVGDANGVGYIEGAMHSARKAVRTLLTETD